MIQDGQKQPSYNHEEKLFQEGHRSIAGIDEAGRGPIAGPVIAASVILPRSLAHDFFGLINDSKKLSRARREYLFPLIKEHSVSWAVGMASHEEIDSMNILKATKLAMQRSINNLHIKPSFLLIDAVELPDSGIRYESIVHGDSLSLSIAAASIIAKETRDNMMRELSLQYPDYEFDIHKGYPTKRHIEHLVNFGPSPIHRQSFAPVRKLTHTNNIDFMAGNTKR